MFGAYSSQVNALMTLSVPLINWVQYENKVESIKKSDLAYKEQLNGMQLDCHYDLNIWVTLQNEIMNEMRLLELHEQRLELMTLNIEYGKLDVSELIRAKYSLLQTKLRIIDEAKTFYTIIYKYRRLALFDLMTEEVLY